MTRPTSIECYACGATDDLRIVDHDGYVPDDLVCADCWNAAETETGQPDFTDLEKCEFVT